MLTEVTQVGAPWSGIAGALAAIAHQSRARGLRAALGKPTGHSGGTHSNPPQTFQKAEKESGLFLTCLRGQHNPGTKARQRDSKRKPQPCALWTLMRGPSTGRSGHKAYSTARWDSPAMRGGPSMQMSQCDACWQNGTEHETFSGDAEMAFDKIHMEPQGLPQSQNNPKKEGQNWRSHTFDFKT